MVTETVYNHTGSVSCNVSTAGWIYFSVESSSSFWADKDTYTLSTSFDSQGQFGWETEASNISGNNDHRNHADPLKSGQAMWANLKDDAAAEKDFFKITVTSAGSISVSFSDSDTNSDELANFYCELQNSSGSVLASGTYDDGGYMSYSNAQVGDYYFVVSSSSNYYADNDEYQIIATFS